MTKNKEEKKEEDSHPHFVSTTNPKNEPWKTNIYFGQRDGLSAHAHIAVSGAAILHIRDEQGNKYVLEGEVKTKNTSQSQSDYRPDTSEEPQHPEQSPSENEDK